MMFYCPRLNFASTRLFPLIGFQIITEPGSPEDLPCLERDKLSNRHLQFDWFPAEWQQLSATIFWAIILRIPLIIIPTRSSPLPDDFASIIYTDRPGRHDMVPFGETDKPQVNQPSKGKSNTMGDRSPKSNRKKSNQKQAKANSADQMKKQAIADKQAAGKQK
ncbi:MAG TPA: hypothetical protein VN836_12715 [Verrucomicrobiae bacterium]|nr:hypothetical protein [Verrucomicrobiae bacterium]